MADPAIPPEWAARSKTIMTVLVVAIGMGHLFDDSDFGRALVAAAIIELGFAVILLLWALRRANARLAALREERDGR